jgi:hypothetical protein
MRILGFDETRNIAYFLTEETITATTEKSSDK